MHHQPKELYITVAYASLVKLMKNKLMVAKGGLDIEGSILPMNTIPSNGSGLKKFRAPNIRNLLVILFTIFPKMKVPLATIVKN